MVNACSFPFTIFTRIDTFPELYHRCIVAGSGWLFASATPFLCKLKICGDSSQSFWGRGTLLSSSPPTVSGRLPAVRRRWSALKNVPGGGTFSFSAGFAASKGYPLYCELWRHYPIVL